MVARTFPIRIAGNSGPLLDELSWADVGVAPEYTTVTKKERRVGAWDGGLVRKAVKANGGRRVSLALSFFDYWFPELHGCTSLPDLRMTTVAIFDAIERVEEEVGAKVKLLGTGPNSVIWL